MSIIVLLANCKKRAFLPFLLWSGIERGQDYSIYLSTAIEVGRAEKI